MRFHSYCIIALLAVSVTASAATTKKAHPHHAATKAGGIDKRFTVAQRKSMFAQRMSIAYRAMYDAKGNEILGDQLADKYRQQFNKRYKLTAAEGNALELEGAAHQWPTQAGKTP